MITVYTYIDIDHALYCSVCSKVSKIGVLIVETRTTENTVACFSVTLINFKAVI